MKKCSFIFGIIIFLFSVLTYSAWAAEINVTGEAEVRVFPDEVTITLGIQTYNENIDIAKEQNDKTVKKVQGISKSYKIDEKYVKSDFLRVEPIYERYEQEINEKIIGYRVRRNIVIILRDDLSVYENLITDVLKTGVNYIHGIQFGTTELRKHRDEARDLAIKAAREKAESLSAAMGQKIGKILFIDENRNYWGEWSWYGRDWWGGSGNQMSQNVIQTVGGDMGGIDGTAIGQIKVIASVSVKFELEPK
ncbi:MAG: SIMPL domain-containing protein [bacterium]